jgi:hypothetical protein
MTPTERILRHCRRAGLPKPALEYQFVAFRDWRFDLAWPDLLIAVEVNGGSFIQGRHTRGAGHEADNEKLAHAAIRGWRVIQCTPGQVERGQALHWIERILRNE